MSRLKVEINCEDCGTVRMITKACLSLVKRCKPCQKKFNRDRARNRYREIKGIPMDKPIASIIKKKEFVAPVEPTYNEPVSLDAWGKPIEVEQMVKLKVELVSPEEQASRKIAMQKLFDMLPDDSMDDDW